MIEFSTIIGFRDWGLDRLALALHSHARSTAAARTEVIVSDYGSFDGTAVKAVVEQYGCTYVRTDTLGPWSRSKALNAGIAPAQGRFILTTDADILFTPEAVGIIGDHLIRDPHAIQLLQCRDLLPDFQIGELESLDWTSCEVNSVFRPRWGMGGMAAFPVEVFELVRGYDERMEIYGGEDIDFANRLRRAGYRLNWIDDRRCRIFHQWHESSRARADQTVTGQAAVERNRGIVEQDKTWVRNLDWLHRRTQARPLVTVAVATHNRERYVGECLESVLSQPIGDIEVVVVDDGSTDGTADVIHGIRDERIRYFHQPHSGVSVARNKVVAEARSPFLMVQDDDDIMLPWRIQAQFSALKEGVHGTYGGWVDFDTDTGALDARPGKGFGIPQLLYSPGVMAHGTLMMRVEVLRHFGYRNDLRAGTDFNLAVRMAMAGVSLRHTGQFHILRRLHAGNLTYTLSDHQQESARRTTNLFRRRFSEAKENAFRSIARQVTGVDCAGADDLQRTVAPYLPDGLVSRMASIPAKDDAVFKRVVAFATNNRMQPHVFRVADTHGQIVDRNCCFYELDKSQIRLLREAGLDPRVEVLAGEEEPLLGVDEAARRVLAAVADLMADKELYYVATLAAAESAAADTIWQSMDLDKRLVVVGRQQFLAALAHFDGILEASAYEDRMQAEYSDQVRTFVMKMAA